MMKKIIALSIVLTAQAYAQNVPPLPGPIQPKNVDKETFICDVSSINEDFIDRTRNLWTTAATGGKFSALSPVKLRVMSASEESAILEVYDFYRKYAASAYIKSPMYDKGNRLTQKFVVRSCVVDKSRATTVDLKKIPLNGYKSLATANDHIVNFLAFNKTPLNEEQIANLMSDGPFLSNAFERNAQIQESASRARKAIKSAAGPNVILNGTLLLERYDFAKKSFDLSNLKRNAEEYLYTSPHGYGTTVPMYDLTVPARFLTYIPNSLEEAKRIEAARARSMPMTLKTYIQIKDASNTRGPVIRGTVGAIEAYTDKGELLFKILAD
jgi:hypothetical protein